MTEQQKRFVDFYIQTANATEAAKRAGYSPRTAYSSGQRLLKQDEIRRVIDERLDGMESERIIQTEEILEHLSDVIRGRVTEVIVTPGGKKFSVPVRETDRLRAAETILKIRGLFRDKVDVKVGGAELFVRTLQQAWNEDESAGGDGRARASDETLSQ
ncbi:MAG: terminase small subunit [Selenomonadaceae bacterium]|nr:terminase small subunit [Selenomonadaceae bacterium]